MEIDVSNIRFSNPDKRMNVLLPTCMNCDIAEFIGIIIGDGHISHHGHRRQIFISGNVKDEDYYRNYVNPLISKIFNIPFNVYFQMSRNSIFLHKQSVAIFSFLYNVIGIPTPKLNIGIPKAIRNSSKEIKTAFLRGLADADFCLTIKYKPNIYPVIHGTSKSKKLIKQCCEIFDELGIKYHHRKESQYYKKRKKRYVTYRVYINGFGRVGKFMELIGFSNENKIVKYEEILKKRSFSTTKHTPKVHL